MTQSCIKLHWKLEKKKQLNDTQFDFWNSHQIQVVEGKNTSYVMLKQPEICVNNGIT